MLNEAKIIGHLGRDPESKTLPSGDTVTNFSIATTEKWKDKQTGEAREATEWHRISMFGKLAEIAAKYLKKGSLVYVCGKIVTRKYQDKDGKDVYSTEIKADTLKMLGGKPEGGSAPAAPAPAAAPRAPAPDVDDDIPF
jgi:single-strand DNA-binding protein